MSDEFKIFKAILEDNKKQILKGAANYYEDEINSISEGLKELGQNAVDFAVNLFSSKKPDDENAGQLKLPERNQGLPLSYTESAFPESKTDGTLELVTRVDMPEAKANSSIFKHMSYGVSGLSARATYNDKAGNQYYSLYLGEKAGFGYEKREGQNDCCRYGVKADYNLFSGRASVGGYYNTPLFSAGASVFYKNGNYGASAEYSNPSGLEAKCAVDKDGAAFKVAYNHQFDDFMLNVGAFGSTEYKTIGVTARMTF